MKNFYEDLIPNADILYTEAIESINNYLETPKYYFKELFTLKNDYYETNLPIFESIGLNNTKVPKSDKPMNEIQGLYVFYEDNHAKYVGISRKIINRLRNHFIGKDHYSASLVYLMARAEEDELNGMFTKRRSDLDFEKYRNKIQPKIRETWQIQIIPETNSYKRALMEILLACRLQTEWNSFDTH